MKSRSALRSFLLLAGSSLLVVSYTHASTFIWDETTGGAQSWGTAANWNPDGVPSPAAGDTVDLSASNIASLTTLTLDADRTAEIWKFGDSNNTHGWAVNSGSQMILNTITANAPVIQVDNQTTTLNNVLAGTEGLNKTGAGSLTLTADNTYSGTTTFSGGTVTVSGAAGDIAESTALVLSGGALTLTNIAGESAITRVSGSAGITSNGGTITWTNPSNNNTENWALALGTLSLTSGQTNIVSSNAVNAARTQVLTLGTGSLTHAAADTSAIAFGGTSLGTGTVNNIVITGQSDTAADQIIGSWATYGGSALSQTDYAVSNINAGVANTRGIQGAGIAASAESTWSIAHAATSNYTLVNASGSAVNGKLTATRNINSLRNTTGAATATANSVDDYFTLASNAFANGDVVTVSGTNGTAAGTPYYIVNKGGFGADTFQISTTPGGGAVNLTNTANGAIAGGITLSAGNNLGTYGILNGSGTALSIGGADGNITLPTTTSGNLFVTPGAGAINIDRPITDNGAGVLTLVKSGSGTLTLSSASTFSGGFTLNGGALVLPTTTDTLGAVGGAVTVAGNTTITFGGVNHTLEKSLHINEGAALTTVKGSGGFMDFTGVVSGSGTINVNNAGGINQRPLTLSNTANTFTGAIGLGANTSTITVASLGDAVGSGSISLGNAAFQLGTQAIAPLVLTNRVFGLFGNGRINNLNTNSGNTLTINSNLMVTAAGAKTLQLGGVNTGANTFAGSIGDSTHAVGGVVSFTKADAGTWRLSNTANTYTGITTISAGTLEVAKLANSGANSSIGASSNAASNLVFNTGSTLRYVGTGDSTDRAMTFGSSGNNAGFTLESSGAGALNFTNTAAITNTSTGGSQARSYTLGGTNTNDNTFAATITDNAANKASVTKSGVGKWVLSGNNTYTGTTTLSAGTLLINGNQSSATGNVLVNGTSTLGGTGTIGGNTSIAATANLAPGVASVGTLSLGGNLTLTETTSDVGTLNFDLGSIASSDKIVVTGTLNVGTDALGLSDFIFTDVGGLAEGVYTLISSGGLSGSLDATDLAGNIGAFATTLATSGNNIILTVGTPSGTPYENWATGGELFDDDANDDGVSNGVAFLLGASGPNANALGLLPAVTQSGGGLVMTFSMLNSASRGTAKLSIEHSSDLGISDTWTTVLVPDTAGISGPTSGVTFDVTLGSPENTVTATISSSEAASGKLFGRLKATE